MKYSDRGAQSATPRRNKSAGRVAGSASKQGSTARSSGTFYFFDLETSGFRAREDRIMQFAGQRTDMNLELVGKPDNFLVKMTDDILPQPEAVLVHGITPQKTVAEGLSETDFIKYLTTQVFTPDTIMVGFNNLRFDNEFMRFTLWRNFADAYEWSWKNGCSTWDLLDVSRMTRALRPDGIKWPFASDGKPSNKLELLAAVNKLTHTSAHDAASDVQALVELARLLKSKQPKIFDYLLQHRGKEKVAPIVTSGKPFIYTSGRYPSEWHKTTIAAAVAPHPEQNAAIVYDLRIDPNEFKDLSPAELAERWQARGDDVPYFPAKVVKFNKCPAVVADIRVLDKDSEERLGLHMELVEDHFKKLEKIEDLGSRLVAALEIMNRPYQQEMVIDQISVDGALYGGFINDSDKIKMRAVRAASGEDLDGRQFDFTDDRLKALLPLYKARNFPESLNKDEKEAWAKFKKAKLAGKLDDYFAKVSELSATSGLSTLAKKKLNELEKWAQAAPR